MQSSRCDQIGRQPQRGPWCAQRSTASGTRQSPANSTVAWWPAHRAPTASAVVQTMRSVPDPCRIVRGATWNTGEPVDESPGAESTPPQVSSAPAPRAPKLPKLRVSTRGHAPPRSRTLITRLRHRVCVEEAPSSPPSRPVSVAVDVPCLRP